MRVLRHQVRADDGWTKITSGPVLYVGSRVLGVVEFWALEGQGVTRWYRIYGTGHATEGDYVGTTYDGKSKDLVWHLFCSDDPS